MSSKNDNDKRNKDAKRSPSVVRKNFSAGSENPLTQAEQEKFNKLVGGGASTSGSKKGPESVASSQGSASVKLSKEVKNLLDQFSKKGTLQGAPILMIDESRVDELREKLLHLMDPSVNTSASKRQLAELNQQLATTRLRLTRFEDEAQKASFAKEVLERDVAKAKEISRKLEEENAKIIKDNHQQCEELRQRLIVAKQANEEAKAELRNARKEKMGVEEATAAQSQAAVQVTMLNNTLEQLKASNSRLVKEGQFLKDKIKLLETEANIVRARANVSPASTFATIAAKAGKAPVNLLSKAKHHLSSRTESFLAKAASVEEGDVKSRAYWLRNALQDCKHKKLAPYTLLLEAIYGDIVVASYKSRVAFSPIVDGILSVLTGKGDVLTVEEINAILDGLDTTQIKMAPKWAKMGFYTLDDWIKAGNHGGSIQDADLLSEAGTEDMTSLLKKRVFGKSGGKRAPAGPPPKPKDPRFSFVRGVKRTYWDAMDTVKTKIYPEAVKKGNWFKNKLKWLNKKLISGVLLICTPLLAFKFAFGTWFGFK